MEFTHNDGSAVTFLADDGTVAVNATLPGTTDPVVALVPATELVRLGLINEVQPVIEDASAQIAAAVAADPTAWAKIIIDEGLWLRFQKRLEEINKNIIVPDPEPTEPELPMAGG